MIKKVNMKTCMKALATSLAVLIRFIVDKIHELDTSLMYLSS